MSFLNSPWLTSLDAANNDLRDQGLVRQLKLRSTPNAPIIRINGEQFLSFCSNDYLGLSNHPLLKQAMSEGADFYGVGSGASALISGHTTAHQILENKLAQMQSLHIPNVGACLMNTGFMANIAMLTPLGSLGAISIYSDELNHASLIDGVRMAKAQSQASVFIYPHNDLKTLQRKMEQDQNPLKIIVTDSVFSMDGDFAPLHELTQIAESHQALLYVDDAHGFGIFGINGHGSLEHLNISSPNIIYMGTLGKAVGVSGAFIAANQIWIDWLIQKSRPVIYSTSPSPAVAHTILKSIELIESKEGQSRRKNLFDLIEYWRQNAHFHQWKCLPSTSAIQPIIIGSNEEALQVAEQLRQSNIWVPAIRPPTVPKNTARLRVTFNADHTQKQVQTLIDQLIRIERTFR
jgi:8-amino-7-oxononanoate synthase